MPSGIFLIASGEVAVVRRDESDSASDPLILGTLGAGDVAGEVATVLRRKTNVEFVAAHPTVTLFLPSTELVSLTESHPTILARLYLLAIAHDEEERSIMSAEASQAEDFDLI
jgi:cAMP-dependent protein kinase regulator